MWVVLKNRKKKMMRIIVDVEATCQEHRTNKFKNEIIQFGVIIDGGAILFEKAYYVKPILNPILTDYCVNLTGITQGQVDQAKTFPEVVKEMSIELNNELARHFHLLTSNPYASEWDVKNRQIVYWGCYDNRQIAQDCLLHKIDFPFNFTHLNAKQLFAFKMNNGKQVGEEKALEILGLKFEGRRHDGLADAKNTWRILNQLSLKGLI